MSGPRAAAAVALLVAACAGCAHGSAPPRGGAATPAQKPANGPSRPEADSLTTALWHLDDPVGTNVQDDGPLGLPGIAGPDTRSDYGRIGRARTFTRSINSFVIVPYTPALDASRAITVEAWIFPSELGLYEDTPIVLQWTPEPLQNSWMLTLIGRNTGDRAHPGTGEHLPLTRFGGPGRILFAFQPEEAGVARAFPSSRPVELERWTHVAATYDGEVVRIYLNGQLDAQYASPGRIRVTNAPVVVGNYLDPRWLTSFGGTLKAGPSVDPYPFYAFSGLIDEVRISKVARLEFPYARGG